MALLQVILLTVTVWPCLSQDDDIKPTNPPHLTLSLQSGRQDPFPSEEVVLLCEIKGGSADWTYQWEKDGVKLEGEEEPRLTFSATPTHSGQYTCKGKQTASVITGESSPLEIAVKDLPEPKLSLQSGEQESFTFERVVFRCEIDGDSQGWKVMWYKNGEKLGDNKNSLQISSTEVSHSGNYTCKGENKQHPSVTTGESSMLTLTVHDRPLAILTLEAGWQESFPSERLIFGCKIVGGSAVWNFGWKRDGQMLTENSESLEITSAKASDSGQYICQGQHKQRPNVTTEESSPYALTVKDRPLAILTLEAGWQESFPSERLIFGCKIVGGSAVWNFGWKRDGQMLTENSESLEITSAKASDSGQYICQGQHKQRPNVTTEESSPYALTVKDRPLAILTLEAGWQESFPSERLVLGCKIVGGSAVWNLRWKRDGQMLTENSESLEITSAKASDSGQYICQGQHKQRPNVTTEESSPYVLTVKDRPLAILTLEAGWQESFPSERLVLGCKIVGGSAVWNLRWKRDGQMLTENSESLEITSAKASDSGQYICQGQHKQRPNVTTEESSPYVLTVKDRKPKPLLSQDPTFPVVYPGEKIVLNCGVKELVGNGWEYLWYHSTRNFQLNSDISESSYMIKSTILQQAGLYWCRVKRGSFKSEYSDPLNLTVENPPFPKLTLQSGWKKSFLSESMVLRCEIKGGSGNWRITWARSGQMLDESSDVLEIKSAKKSDSGQYTCKGQHRMRTVVTTGESSPLSLGVYGKKPKPLLSREPTFPVMYPGEKMVLNCKVTEPSIDWKYSWYQNSTSSTPLNADTSKQSYIINASELIHTGTYWCFVSRGHLISDSSDPQSITVQHPPLPKLSVDSEWKEFFPSERVRLKCKIPDGSADWTYIWYRNGQELSENNYELSGETLAIGSAEPKHAGQYTCAGQHRHRSVKTGSAEIVQLHVYGEKPRLILNYHPSSEIIYTKEKVSFCCRVGGNSTGWTYSWYKGNQEEALSNTVLTNYTIGSASLSDSGGFRCQAKRDSFSQLSEPVSINVRTRPVPALSHQIDWESVLAVNTLRLRCDIQEMAGEWNYTWYRDGEELGTQGSKGHYDVTATENITKIEFRCRGNRTERPLYSDLSQPFKVHNIVLKKKVLLALSGCLVSSIAVMILGCIYLKITRKSAVLKETPQEDLFFSMTELKSQTSSPLSEYMTENKCPSEMEENAESIDLICAFTPTLTDEVEHESKAECSLVEKKAMLSFSTPSD